MTVFRNRALTDDQVKMRPCGEGLIQRDPRPYGKEKFGHSGRQRDDGVRHRKKAKSPGQGGPELPGARELAWGRLPLTASEETSLDFRLQPPD